MAHHDEDKRLKAEGKLDELEGRAQAAWGDLTDDTSDQIAGKAKEIGGKAKQAVGEVMDEVGDAADKLDGNRDGN